MKRIEVKVIARAKKEALLKISDNNYKIKVSSPPERYKANQRVIELLSSEFGLKRSDVKIVSGHTSNRKIIEITNG